MGIGPGSGWPIWGVMEGSAELGVTAGPVSQLSHDPGLNKLIEQLRDRERELTSEGSGKVLLKK